MYSILLVDDEPMVKVAFRKMLAGSDRYTLDATASNGLEALRILEQTPVDIVITDINMPRMNGLKLINALREREYEGCVLVLSNYSDFEMVRQALLNGALDYILKVELQSELLADHLDKAATALEKTRSTRQAALANSRRANLANRAAILREYLNAGDGENPPAVLAAQGAGPLYLLDIRLWPGDGTRQGISMQNAAEVLRSVIEETTPLDVAEMYPGELCCLVPLASLAAGGHTLEGRLEKLRHALGAYFGCDTSVILCRPAPGLKALPAQYKAICRASEVFFYPARPPQLDADDLVFADLPADYRPAVVARDITGHFSIGGPEAVAAYTDKLLAACQTQLVYPKQVKSLLYNVAGELLLQLEEDQRGELGIQIDLAMLECKSLAALRETFLSTVPPVLEHMLPPEYHSCKGEIQSTLRYIQFNYRDRIRLQEIAEAVNLHPSYLCRLFKKETGKSLFQHIQTLRMETAARLIEQGDIYIKEIAVAVGLDDPFYFTRQFKKYHGVSPTEYKEERKK